MSNLPDNYSDVVLRLRDGIGLKTLIETGSYGGFSVMWAADLFDRIVSIDIRSENQVLAMVKCAGKTNIKWIAGDSRTALRPVVEALREPAFFWLDAHEEQGKFGCEHDDCPVMEELEAISASPFRHVILIDDVHCFSEPYDPAVWPRLERIQAAARSAGYVPIKVRYGLLLLDPIDVPLIGGFDLR